MNYSDATIFYVRQGAGSDGASGLYPEVTSIGDGPLATIGVALRHIREMRRVGHLQPVTIRLLGDRYELEAPLQLDEALGVLTIEPAHPGRFELSAGRRLTGFRPAVFNGAACAALELPEVKEGSWRFSDLFVGECRAALTRFPEKGVLYAESVENTSTELFSPSKWFVACPGDLDGITVGENTWLNFCHYWIDEHTPVESYDHATRKMTLKYASRFTITGDKGSASAIEYWLENLPESFGKPGQWYLDTVAGILYYTPTERDPAPEQLVAYAPRLERIADITGKNIVLRGLTLCHTKGEYASRDNHLTLGDVSEFASDSQSVSMAHGVVNLHHAADCRVENCVFTHYGVHGLVARNGVHALRVDNCRFEDGGAGGIVLDGGRADSELSERTYGNCIENNIIRDGGQRYYAGCGILMMHSYENRVSHNTICNMRYSGISVGWVWGYTDSVSRDNILEYNHIHHIGGGMLSDMGGIYLLGKQPGTVVRGNHIHHVQSRHYGGWALYSDEGSSYQLFENNLCYACTSNCYHIHYGSMNVLRNNIFYGGGDATLCISRLEMHLYAVMEQNILVAENTLIYNAGGAKLGAGTIVTRNNLLFDTTGREPVFTRVGERDMLLNEAQTLGQEEGSLVGDPLFRDPENGDFALAENSPAFRIGFVPFDVSGAGAHQ